METALALVLGDIRSSPPVVRIHSQCVTGEVFHSLRCDCQDQLNHALHVITAEGAGVLIYEQQEGRGIGLMEKLRAYQLQDQGSTQSKQIFVWDMRWICATMHLL